MKYGKNPKICVCTFKKNNNNNEDFFTIFVRAWLLREKIFFSPMRK